MEDDVRHLFESRVAKPNFLVEMRVAIWLDRSS